MHKDKVERLAEAEIRLSYFFAKQIEYATTYFGYPEVPENNDLAILGISSLAKLHLNNAGDPWVQGNAKMHTKEFEKEALDFVAKIYGIENNYWGYITSGGTEGNLYGIYTGREYFFVKKKKPIFLYSDSSHYSIPKNGYLLGIERMLIKSQISGEIDYTDLKVQLKNIISRNENYGIVLNLNIGTTMTGAIDSIKKVNQCLDEININRKDILIHADAALMGFIYPFTKGSENLFKNGVNSIAISGHKFPGAINPCGIILTNKTTHDIAFGEQWVPYLKTHDTTISGSRNGFLAINLWYIFQKKGIKGFKTESKKCIANAKYLASKLKKMDYPNVSHFPNQIIVTFKKPIQQLVSKYQLATQEDLAHVVVMQHITKSRIDGFCKELKASI